MKLEFKQLIIENFLSIGSADINLQDRGFTLIKGINNNPLDSAKSNGSGKSSILEAISWALTGETIRGIKDVVNMFQPGGTKVELTFKVNADEFHIIRYKEHSQFKTDLKIFINGQDKSGKGIRDSQQLLISYIPDLTSSLLGSVVLLGQGLPQRFTNNTPSGRKEVLEKLSKSDFMIEDLKKRISARQIYLKQSLRELEDNLLAAKTKASTLENQIKISEAKLQSLEDPSLYDEAITRTKDRLRIFEEQLIQFTQNIKDSRIQVEEFKEKLSKESNTYNAQLAELHIIKASESKQLELDIQALKSRISQLEKEVRDAHNIKDTCPTCGRKFENVFIPNTEAQELEIKQLQEQLSKLAEQLAALNKTFQEKESQITFAYNEKTISINKDLSVAKAHLSNYETAFAKTNNEKQQEEQSLNRYEQLKTSYNVTVETLTKSIAEDTKQIEEINKNIVYYNEDILAINDHIVVVNKFNTLTTRDFRGYLLKNIIQFIDQKAKEYCKEVFDTDAINFVLDGNNIDIRYCGKQYESLSGGEKQKIDVIVQLSIREMLCQFLDFRANIISLDEIFDGLDSVGCARIIDLISRQLVDISSVFIITHHADLQIPEDSCITVIKGANGVSTVE